MEKNIHADILYFFYSKKELHIFMSNYFQKQTSRYCEIKLTWSGTSYISMGKTNQVHISGFNLIDIYKKAPKYFRKLHYTIISHEFAHAVYTGRNLPHSTVRNVIEDMRIEYQTEKWNKKTRFDLMRYIFQDKEITILDLDSITNIALALLRTVNNEPYIKYFELLGIDLTKLMDLAEDYKNLEHKLGLSGSGLAETIKLGEEIEDELKRLFDLKEEAESKQDKTKKKTKDSSPTQKEEIIKEKYDNELFGLEANPNLREPGKERLKNPNVTSYKPPFYRLSITDTVRRTGIKGNVDTKTRMGSPSNFNAKSYIARKHTGENKHFNRRLEKTKGGKTVDLVIYLDISASMAEWTYANKTRIQIAVDYLANLYDQSHKHINIRMMTFGSGNKIITRNELDPKFLMRNLESYTIIFPDRVKRDEMIIVITDGEFSNNGHLPEKFLKRAHFIIIESAKTNIRSNKKYHIHTSQLKETMNRITQKLRGELQKC